MSRLKTLEAYLQVASLGSVTAAARHLGVSQPSVSRMIQELERDLGQPLFERAGQRLVLTPKGMVLRDDVERALAGFVNLWERAREVVGEAEPPIRVSAVSALAFGLLTDAWKAIGCLDEPPRLAIEVENPDRVQNSVMSGTAQIGATSAPLLHRDLTVEWLGTAPCVLAVPEGDPLARREGPVELQALAGRSLVGMSMRRGVPARIRAALNAAGVDVRVRVRTTSTINALSFIEAGAGVAIVEPLTLTGRPTPGVRILPLATPIPYCFGVVTARGVAVPDKARELIAALQIAAQERLDDFTLIPPEEHHALLASLTKQEMRL
ncbi:LysR family transcriptional regulator [Bosea sp. RAF48]|uniref:LysR family transcriptional regulator n=1 Tax=Bosea sp. RAF48 TaxID=3237480 RepID=UPI003F919849